MSDEMKKAVEAMQEAVDKEMERKAKLGYTAIIGDKDGNPIEVPAKLLVRRRKARQRAALKRKKAKGESLS